MDGLRNMGIQLFSKAHINRKLPTKRYSFGWLVPWCLWCPPYDRPALQPHFRYTRGPVLTKFQTFCRRIVHSRFLSPSWCSKIRVRTGYRTSRNIVFTTIQSSPRYVRFSRSKCQIFTDKKIFFRENFYKFQLFSKSIIKGVSQILFENLKSNSTVIWTKTGSIGIFWNSIFVFAPPPARSILKEK